MRETTTSKQLPGISNFDIPDRPTVLARELSKVLTRGSLSVYLQPIFMTECRRFVGAEALVRWEHPILGQIQPTEIVTAAEHLHLSNTLLNFVLKAAILVARDWRNDTFISVNLTPSDLVSETLTSQVLDSIRNANFPASRLCLEISESERLDKNIRAQENISALQNAGIRIALDDFGSGYMSFDQTRRLNSNYIKIDRSLVSDCHKDRAKTIIIESIRSLATLLGRQVIAEGAETDEEVRHLSDLNIHMIQGYALGRPMQISDINKLVQSETMRSGAGLIASK